MNALAFIYMLREPYERLWKADAMRRAAAKAEPPENLPPEPATIRPLGMAAINEVSDSQNGGEDIV